MYPRYGQFFKPKMSMTGSAKDDNYDSCFINISLMIVQTISKEFFLYE